MSDPTDLTARLPHTVGWQVCLRCLNVHMAVCPVYDPPKLTECPTCGAMACIPFPEVEK